MNEYICMLHSVTV